MATDSIIDGDIHAFMAKVIGHGETFDPLGNPSRGGYGVTDKVHAPGLVHRFGGHQRHAYPDALDLLAFTDSQTLLCVKPVNTFVVDVGILGPQQVVDHPVAPTSARMGCFNDFAQQLSVQGAGRCDVSVGVSA